MPTRCILHSHCWSSWTSRKGRARHGMSDVDEQKAALIRSGFSSIIFPSVSELFVQYESGYRNRCKLSGCCPRKGSCNVEMQSSWDPHQTRSRTTHASGADSFNNTCRVSVANALRLEPHSDLSSRNLQWKCVSKSALYSSEQVVCYGRKFECEWVRDKPGVARPEKCSFRRLSMW